MPSIYQSPPPRIRLAAIALVLLSASVFAQDDDEDYSDEHNAPSAKIRVCTLPNGAKAYGDKCPSGAQEKKPLDAEALARRSQGLDSENSEKMLQYSADQESEYKNKRAREEYQAQAERYQKYLQEQDAQRRASRSSNQVPYDGPPNRNHIKNKDSMPCSLSHANPCQPSKPKPN
jgi:hypothetical protein